jgi:hypothetical protein
MFGSTDKRRRRFIEEYAFLPGVIARFGEERPGLTDEHTRMAFDGLREWIHLQREDLRERRFLSMPLSVVHGAWHTFILVTRDDHALCREACGGYLHHTPSEALADDGPSLFDGLIETGRDMSLPRDRAANQRVSCRSCSQSTRISARRMARSSTRSRCRPPSRACR